MTSKDWPVLTRASLVTLLKQNGDFRIGTSLEHFGSLGFHMTLMTGCSWPVSRLRELLLRLTPAQVKSIAGNGMDLTTQGAWMAYVLANTIRINRIMQVQPMMEAGSGSWEELEDDDSG